MENVIYQKRIREYQVDSEIDPLFVRATDEVNGYAVWDESVSPRAPVAWYRDRNEAIEAAVDLARKRAKELAPSDTA